ncbi:hypothetical protein M9H77_26995 [Catharanthus roseus]|uniref:Uncharacterized protein n=1 Tax=Catharanthus roseus TaxID=4058 RepID=A0ACC0ADY5_CATRO|nr:hypothetical protein M9H77_26995 [Catharanthus roseus]
MMVFLSPKRRPSKSIDEGRGIDEIHQGCQQFVKEYMERGSGFPILELETNILYEILSRLPLRSILACRCVCKTFLKILKDDPFFIQLHLARARTTVNLVLEGCVYDQSWLVFSMFDLDQGFRASCSIDCQHSSCRPGNPFSPARAWQNAEFCILNRRTALVGECNGLLCLYSDLSSQPLYVICNPVLGEYLPLPYLSPSTTPVVSYFNISGFGFSESGEYKVIHFASLKSVDPLTSLPSRKMVVDIGTLSSGLWRRISDAPCPKIRGSFDSLLNGSLHWITNSHKPAELLCSLNLESENFMSLPPPSHFNLDFMNKISGTNVGVLGGSLCLCYVKEKSHFEAWVMKDYGVKESWMKQFSIDIAFYSGLRRVDFYKPLKFLSNGELWLQQSFNCLISYNPQTGTFKDFEVPEHLSNGIIQGHQGPTLHSGVILHYPTLISLQNAVKGKNLTVVKYGKDRRTKVFLA